MIHLLNWTNSCTCSISLSITLVIITACLVNLSLTALAWSSFLFLSFYFYTLLSVFLFFFSFNLFNPLHTQAYFYCCAAATPNFQPSVWRINKGLVYLINSDFKIVLGLSQCNTIKLMAAQWYQKYTAHLGNCHQLNCQFL